MNRFPRYHVQHGHKRTTVSLTITLAQLLAIHLGHTPDSAPAHRAIRQWLQHQLDQSPDPGRDHLSQWLQSQIVFALIARPLYERHAQWLLSSLDQRRAPLTVVNG